MPNNQMWYRDMTNSMNDTYNNKRSNFLVEVDGVKVRLTDLDDILEEHKYEQIRFEKY